jgi:hypothetical protein
MFVAVGSGGTIITSQDGSNWTKRSSNSNAYLIRITYGNGVFVTVGEGGTILTSPNGADWTQRPSGTTKMLWSISFENGLFTIETGLLTVLTSSDGLFWKDSPRSRTEVPTQCSYDNGLPNYSYGGYAFGKGTCVIVGANLAPGFSPYPTREVIFTSTGTGWKQTYDGDSSRMINVVTYANGRFVAMSSSPNPLSEPGRIFVSTDGISWAVKESITPAWMESLIYGNHTFVAVGSNGTIIQSDPMPNEAETIGVPSMNEWGIMLFVVLAGLGSILILRRQKRMS